MDVGVIVRSQYTSFEYFPNIKEKLLVFLAGGARELVSVCGVTDPVW